tara:strand:+ start:1052 stop:1225 length:174 start_codon:yes stop_codon:yes gene_type:complete
MEIKNAQYLADENGTNKTVRATIDGSVTDVSMDTDNRHYAEILKQVAEKKLTIKDAD